MISARQEFLILTILNTAKSAESDYLCEKLAISERTLREDIKEINQFLSNYEIQVKQTTNSRYFVEEEQKKNLAKIMKDYETVCEWLPETPAQRHFIIMFFLLWRDKRITMDEISEEIFVSKSCVFHDVKHLGEFVKQVTDQELDIHRAKGIKFTAEESVKRKVISAMIYRHFRSDANYLMRIFMLFKLGDDTQYNQLVFLYQKHFNEHNIVLTDYGFTTLVLENLAFAGRIRDGYFLGEEEVPELECVTGSNLPFEELEQILSVSFNETERKWLQFIFAQKRTLSIGELQETASSSIDEIVLSFVEEVKKQYGLDLSKAPEQLDDLKKHIKSMLSRIKLSYHEDSYLAKKIMKEVEKEYEISGVIIPIIEEYTGIAITEIERAYIALHITVILEKLNRPVHTLLVSNSSAIMVQRLQSKITKMFSGQIVIEGCYTTHQMDYILKNKKGIDLILTTHTLKKDITIPVINMHELFMQEDWEHIGQYLKNMSL